MLDFFQTFNICILYIASLLVFLYISYKGFPAAIFTVFFTIFFLFHDPSMLFWKVFIVLNVIFLVKPVRRALVTKFIMKAINAMGGVPKISDTEEIALRAGNTWIEKELFSGRPNFKRISTEPYPSLTREEKSFLNKQVEMLCEMTDDWKVYSNRDLPEKVWQYLKDEKFFGMIVPKKYGGLGFSALAHSTIIAKLASRSQVLAITAMVPNSLGPAELLLHYGTKKQRDHYLPRLAKGKDIPCFALTEPLAGSDATSIKAEGVVFKDEEGNVKIRLNFRKRYITLGAVATLVGLAFKIKDPHNLFGKGVYPGITCALIEKSTPGITIDRRHDPLNIPFVNSPIVGKNVIIDPEQIIGGRENVGQGWKMLMESLSVGRGISLPATSTGGAKLVTNVVGNYALVRRQFGLPIGKFEGVQAKLAEVAGFTYMLESARVFTAGAIDNGYKPAVTNAIAKYHFTEKFREIINHGMDILGGAAICRGPKNLLAHAYMGTPIAITVEGANIMTRSLIHFGQGAIRCHPYSYDEMKALINKDVDKFDECFFSHIGHLYRNLFRSMLLSLSRGRLHISKSSGLLGKYESKLAWASSSFALYADLALAVYGGNIKRKEQINGRFGDILSAMYFASSLMRRYVAEGKKAQDKDYFIWAMEYCFHMIQEGFTELYRNFSPGIFGSCIRFFVGFYNRINPIGSYPGDKLSRKISNSLIDGSVSRKNLTEDIFISQNSGDALAKLEKCYEETLKGDVIMKKIKKAIAQGKVKKDADNLINESAKAKVITKAEQTFLTELQKLQLEVVEVNSFVVNDYLTHKMKKPSI